MQSLVGAVPRSRLTHREKDFIGFLIEREKIDNTGLLNSAARRFANRIARVSHSGRFLDFARNDKDGSE